MCILGKGMNSKKLRLNRLDCLYEAPVVVRDGLLSGIDVTLWSLGLTP